MSAQTLTEAKGHEPLNYVPMVTEYSWWQSKTGTRKFVIVRVRYDFPDEACKTTPLPHRVEILELDKSVPVEKLWTEFVQLVKAGEMVKLN